MTLFVFFPAGDVDDPVDRLGVLHQTADRQGFGAGDGDDARPRHIVAVPYVDKFHSLTVPFLKMPPFSRGDGIEFPRSLFAGFATRRNRRPRSRPGRTPGARDCQTLRPLPSAADRLQTQSAPADPAAVCAAGSLQILNLLADLFKLALGGDDEIGHLGPQHLEPIVLISR